MGRNESAFSVWIGAYSGQAEGKLKDWIILMAGVAITGLMIAIAVAVVTLPATSLMFEDG